MNNNINLKLWLRYFNNYINKRNIKNSLLYIDNNNNKILIIPQIKEYPLKSNIFKLIEDNAYQYYSITNELLLDNNKLISLKYFDNYIILDNIKFYKTKLDITNINFFPFEHSIDFRYEEVNNKYKIIFVADIYTEYVKILPNIYLNKESIPNKLSTYHNIHKYLLDNKYIGNLYIK